MTAGGPAVGAEFAGHRIEAVIGEGGMGVVYRARNLALDRVRALKVLAPALSDDARFRERFRRESRLAASIEHPNVIPVHQAGEEGGHLYLAMRLVEGRDLRELVTAGGPLAPGAAAAVIGDVADGLDAAHAAQLIHRDVKPANVLVGGGADAGRVFLTDFGISRTMSGGETVTGTGELVGTVAFVAPEQITGDPVDHRADIYALGAVLYFTLTGQSPFPRENELATLFAHTNAPRPRPSEAMPALTPDLDPIVERAMAVDPEQRFGSAGALRRALDRVIEGEPTVALSARRPAPAPPTTVAAPPVASRRRVWPFVAAAAGLAAAAAAAVLLAGGSGDGKDGASAPTVGTPIAVGRSPTAIAVGPERVWVAAREGDEVDAIDRATDSVAFEIPVPSPTSVAVGFGSVWATSKTDDALYRLDPLEGVEPLAIPLGDGADPTDVAVDNRWVWVANAGAQDVVRVDPDPTVGRQRPARHRAAGARDRRRLRLGDEHPRRVDLAHRPQGTTAARKLDPGRRAAQRRRCGRGCGLGDQQPERHRVRVDPEPGPSWAIRSTPATCRAGSPPGSDTSGWRSAVRTRSRGSTRAPALRPATRSRSASDPADLALEARRGLGRERGRRDGEPDRPVDSALAPQQPP